MSDAATEGRKKGTESSAPLGIAGAEKSVPFFLEYAKSVMLRTFLLFLSNQKQLRRWMETSPIAGRMTKRFIAGLTLEDGLAVCKRLERDGMLSTLDRLGESVTSEAEAEAARDGYLEALRRIHGAGVPTTVSIKLTQFGLDLSDKACRANVELLVLEACRLGNRVEIDMESSEYVDRTLAIVREMHERYHNVRGVIQSYLRRSERDAEALCHDGVPVRLCKGAYREPASVAFQRKAEVNESYKRLSHILLERGNDPGFATHDPKMIDDALRFASARGIARDRFEFQMLYGIRRDLNRKLVAEGYRLRLYVPYGDAWYPYFMRRLAERPANALFLLRNLFRS